MRLYKLIFKRKSIDMKSEWSDQQQSQVELQFLGAREDSYHSGLCIPASFCPSSCLLCPLITLVDNFSVRVYPNVNGHFINRWVSGGWIEVKEGDRIAVKTLLLLTETRTHTHTQQRGHRISSDDSSYQTRGVWHKYGLEWSPGLKNLMQCPKLNFPLIF